MSLALGTIRVERTGFRAGDRVLPFIARCWLSAGFDGLRFSYGATAAEAEANLRSELDGVALDLEDAK